MNQRLMNRPGLVISLRLSLAQKLNRVALKALDLSERVCEDRDLYARCEGCQTWWLTDSMQGPDEEGCYECADCLCSDAAFRAVRDVIDGLDARKLTRENLATWSSEHLRAFIANVQEKQAGRVFHEETTAAATAKDILQAREHGASRRS